MTTTIAENFSETPEFEHVDHDALTLVQLPESRRVPRLMKAGAALAVVAAGIQLSVLAQTRIRGK